MVCRQMAVMAIFAPAVDFIRSRLQQTRTGWTPVRKRERLVVGDSGDDGPTDDTDRRGDAGGGGETAGASMIASPIAAGAVMMFEVTVAGAGGAASDEGNRPR